VGSNSALAVRLMEGIRAIIGRYPERELDIRRLCRRDVEFMSICSDYGEAALALRNLQTTATSTADVRVNHYSTFLDELEAEILERLSRSHPRV